MLYELCATHFVLDLTLIVLYYMLNMLNLVKNTSRTYFQIATKRAKFIVISDLGNVFYYDDGLLKTCDIQEKVVYKFLKLTGKVDGVFYNLHRGIF